MVWQQSIVWAWTGRHLVSKSTSQILTSCFRCSCKSSSRSFTSCINILRCSVYEKRKCTLRNDNRLCPWRYAPHWNGSIFSGHQAVRKCNFPEYSRALCRDTSNNPLQHRRAPGMLMWYCPTGSYPPNKHQTKRLRQEKSVIVSDFIFALPEKNLILSLKLTWHERNDKVIHALNIRGSRVSYGSDVENALNGPEIVDIHGSC